MGWLALDRCLGYSQRSYDRCWIEIRTYLNIMNIYSSKLRYSETTGEPSHTVEIVVARFCDYCGKRFDLKRPTITYSIVDHSGYEPWFDGEELIIEEADSEPLRVDLYSLHNNHPEFVYCQSFEDERDCCVLMIEGLIKKQCGSLCDAMVIARLAIIKKLIENGTFTSKELSLDF